jgi:hypothetical protein
MVTVSILSSYEALKKGWNFQPSFQRQTKPSKALASALKVSAHNEALVIPVMLRNNEIGDGRKRMLVLQDWLANEKKPSKDTFASDWKRLLEGTQVVVCDYDLPLADFLVEFQSHNQVNERMSSGELLNAEFHGFSEDVQAVIARNQRVRQNRRLAGLSFLGYLLTGSGFNTRTGDVLKKVKNLKSLTPDEVDKQLNLLEKMSDLSEQIAFAVKDAEGVRAPSSKSDQASLLRLIQNFDTDSLRGEFGRLRIGWTRYIESTKEQPRRESTGEDYSLLADCLELND